MKHIILSTYIAAMSFTLGAQTRAEHDGIQAIKEIHESWLIVRLPGFEKKLATLDSLLAIESLSEKARTHLVQERSETLELQKFIHKWYPVAFDSVYTFSQVAFIYTHETLGFQKGKIPARTESGEPLKELYLKDYFFATLNGDIADPFRFTSKDHRLLSSPFPNNIGMPGFLIPGLFSEPKPAWIAALEPDDDEIYRVFNHVLRVNRKLSSFYQKKYIVSNR